MPAARHGALAVLEPGTGAPLASRVGVATDLDGAPVILVSGLAAHTGALLADPRCSLLLGEPGKGDPLAYPRISLSCRAARLHPGSPDHARVQRRYLNRNPKARLYAALSDFSFFRLDPGAAALNGGFAKAYRLARTDLLVTGSINDDLADAEQDAIDHMNTKHRGAVTAIARAHGGIEREDWFISGIDADGIDLSGGNEVLRAFFPRPLTQLDALRPTLTEMANAGRDAKAT